MFAKVAYGVTAALTVAVVVAELLHAPTLLIFAATALAARWTPLASVACSHSQCTC